MHPAMPMNSVRSRTLRLARAPPMYILRTSEIAGDPDPTAINTRLSAQRANTHRVR
jgi:hypothetical protein